MAAKARRRQASPAGRTRGWDAQAHGTAYHRYSDPESSQDSFPCQEAGGFLFSSKPERSQGAKQGYYVQLCPAYLDAGDT